MPSFSENQWLEAWLSHAQGKQVDIDLPEMPPLDTQKLTNNKSGYQTIEHAIPFYKILCNAINTLSCIHAPVILDLGAGWGRFSALLSQHGYDLHAVDVEEKLVEAGQKFLPEATWSVISSGEAIAYPDNTFDLVFSNSVFSHLSEESHLHTVAEVTRLLKPAGLFIATTLSESNLKNILQDDANSKWMTSILGDTTTCFSKLANDGFVYGPTSRWKDYGIAVINSNWLSRYWPPELKIIETIEDDPDQQSVTIAQKTKKPD